MALAAGGLVRGLRDRLSRGVLPPSRNLVATALEASGLAAMLAGVWMIYEPIALIAGGLFAMLLANGAQPSEDEDGAW